MMTETQETPRPEWLPEKFSSPEQMAESYAELERRLSSPPPAETPPPVETPPAEEAPPAAETPTVPEGTTVEDLTLTPETPSGDLDFSKYDREVLETGELSEASLAEIRTKFNIPDQIVQSYVVAKKAEARMALQEIVAETGGMENYKAFQAWAMQKLTQAQQEAFNAQLGSPDAEVRKMAVRGLYAQYRASAGDPEAGLVAQGAASGSPVQVFRSEAEFQEAMRDPRFSQDPAYRAEVEARTKESLRRGTIK